MRAASSRSVAASSAKTERKPPRIDARDAGASDGTTYKYGRGRTCRPTGLEADSEDVAHRNVTPDGTMDRLAGTDASKATTAHSYRLLDAEQRLRTKLDDVTHVLTGLLEPLEAQKGRLLPTRSVLELIKLLQDPEMLQVVKMDGERRRIETEMKQVLVQQLGRCEVTGSETFDVSLAVLVYFLSSHAATKCWFDDHELLDVVVYALKRAIVREGANEHETQVTQQAKMEANESMSTFPAAVEVENCLKRKKRSKTLKDAATVKAAAAGETAACGKLVATTTLAVSTAQILDESCWVQLDALLHDHESFYVEGKLHVSVVSALSAALLSLLQVGEVLSSLTPGLNQQYQQKSCDASSYDAAENACQRMRARKSQLVRNGGVYALMRDLAQKVHNLTATVPLTRVGAITMECVELLQRIKTLLCVFDQVTFLTSDVQRYISEKRAIFALSLKLIHLLSEMSWGTRAQGRWKAEPTRMSLTMETLLSALRVLINLAHHNLEAAQHIFALDGMQLLAASFFKLLGFVEGAKKHPLQLSAARKWEFDACLLLLSVMVNCIEFSEDNRAALAGVSLTHSESACGAGSLFVCFFLDKMQSYQHLIDMFDTEGASGANCIDDEGDDWNPEDVILGGCTSLLLGYLIEGSTANRALILSLLPGCSPWLLLRALGVFVAFHSQIGALTREVATSVLHVEEVLKSCQEGLRGAHHAGLLTDAAEVSFRVAEKQCGSSVPSLKFVTAAKSKSAAPFDISSGVAVEELVDTKSGDASSPFLRGRAVKNVCSRLADSDEVHEPRGQVQTSNRDGPQVFVKHVSALVNSYGKRPYADCSVGASHALQSNIRSPLRPSISSPATVLSDDYSSSPVVTRLMKRTREIVEELDAELAKSDDVASETKFDGGKASTVPSSCMVLTMNLTCRENESDGLDIAQDVLRENCNAADMSTNKIIVEQAVCGKVSSMRKQKHSHHLDGTAKKAVFHEGSLFEFAPTGTYYSTPLGKHEGKVLLQTPTKSGHSSSFDRTSPSLNLTPTKTTPLAPSQSQRSQKLLYKSSHSSITNQPPWSVKPLRRKAKGMRAASSSIFDFTDSD